MESSVAKSVCLSLEELCLHNAIDNVASIGNVGRTDAHHLRIILPHCTAEQLWRIEEATTDRDLSPITNDLWLQLYTRKFGDDNVQSVLEKMKAKRKTYSWKALYQAKLIERHEVQEVGVNRLRALYKEAAQQKASRKVQLIEPVPPPSKKRAVGSGGSGVASLTTRKVAVRNRKSMVPVRGTSYRVRRA